MMTIPCTKWILTMEKSWKSGFDFFLSFSFLCFVFKYFILFLIFNFYSKIRKLTMSRQSKVSAPSPNTPKELPPKPWLECPIMQSIWSTLAFLELSKWKKWRKIFFFLFSFVFFFFFKKKGATRRTIFFFDIVNNTPESQGTISVPLQPPKRVSWWLWVIREI